ncbi:carbohydrate-binding family 9-like protein [Cyclobacterium jeungdonense]|uniref:Carbohydrate-binding family 9-like protein n=1 Tax=Cyclobacterium jeungdonense TaxID=708087 RepID=A0ABT8CAZ2_9BACT|nr:carbohydrate-binding family 9-like protein [Cyclobacterium jeungdonense]MDN3688846.1 carbohydrate-binding family 9-like protein [Cyclobacterium jeungdonense]
MEKAVAQTETDPTLLKSGGKKDHSQIKNTMKKALHKEKQPREMRTLFERYLMVCTLALLLFACGDPASSRLNLPTLSGEIQVDGRIDEKAWERAWIHEGLISPWPEEGNEDKTTFRAFKSPEHFNFFFEVRDNSLTMVAFQNEASVEQEDRVELFFSSDTTLVRYYCIEIDPNGNVLDYSAAYYREFDPTWDFTSKELATKITDTGYFVEGRISLNELSELGISSPFYLGIFRADFKRPVGEAVTWFSWKRPKSTTPDFHIPSAFGETVLMK